MPRALSFLTARSAQGGMFLNGDGLSRWGGAGETEGVDGRAVRQWSGEELVEGGEVGGRVIDSCRQNGS